MKDCADQVQACLDAVFATMAGGPVTDAMAYACQGGKRVRAFLVMESAQLFDVPDQDAVFAAAAVEAVHAYSLIHDDLPAMDDDDLRRGRATVHLKWDEATAVLAGDGLQALGFELLCDPRLAADPGARLRLIAELSQAAGARGMVRGQALDIAAETAETPPALADITEMQALKTGALIAWSATAGAVLAGAPKGPLLGYAHALGLAFQIADDILDVEGDAMAAGKRLGKDAGRGKATFVSVMGIEAAKTRASALVDEACAALGVYGAAAENLQAAARFVISRQS